MLYCVHISYFILCLNNPLKEIYVFRINLQLLLQSLSDVNCYDRNKSGEQ